MQRKVAIKEIIGLGPNNTTAYVNDIVEVTEDQLKSIGKDRLVEPTEADMVSWRRHPDHHARPSGADPRMGISDSRPGAPDMGRPDTTDPRTAAADIRTVGEGVSGGREHTIDQLGQALAPTGHAPQAGMPSPEQAKVPQPLKPQTPEPTKKDK